MACLNQLFHPSHCYHMSPNPVSDRSRRLLRRCSHRDPHSHFSTWMTLPQQISMVSSLKSSPPFGKKPRLLAEVLRLPAFSGPLVPLPPGWRPGCRSGSPLSDCQPLAPAGLPTGASLLCALLARPWSQRLSSPRGLTPQATALSLPVMVMACFLPHLCPGKLPTQCHSARNICSTEVC